MQNLKKIYVIVIYVVLTLSVLICFYYLFYISHFYDDGSKDEGLSSLKIDKLVGVRRAKTHVSLDIRFGSKLLLTAKIVQTVRTSSLILVFACAMPFS